MTKTTSKQTKPCKHSNPNDQEKLDLRYIYNMLLKLVDSDTKTNKSFSEEDCINFIKMIRCLLIGKKSIDMFENQGKTLKEIRNNNIYLMFAKNITLNSHCTSQETDDTNQHNGYLKFII